MQLFCIIAEVKIPILDRIPEHEIFRILIDGALDSDYDDGEDDKDSIESHIS
jgi:hypothetical protein